MEVFDIICSECSSVKFKDINGEFICQDCGHILSDEEIDSILDSVYDRKDGKVV